VDDRLTYATEAIRLAQQVGHVEMELLGRRLRFDGRVRSEHVYFDQMGFLTQLGLLPG
jgi:hypothetical protein